MIKFTTLDLVDVLWQDAHSPRTSGYWQDPESFDDTMEEPFDVHTVGYLVRKSRELVAVISSASIDSHGDVSNMGGAIIIPRKMVVKIDVLRKGRG